MMLGGIALNGEKMLLGWFERSNRLTSAVTNKLRRLKFLHGLGRSLRSQITSSNKTERRHTRGRLCRTGWTPAWAFGSNYWHPHTPDSNPLDFSLRMHIKEEVCKTCHISTDEVKSSVNRAIGFVRKACKSFRLRLERIIEPKMATLSNLMSLIVIITLRFKNCLMSL